MTIMGGIAEFERNLIRKRCEDEILRAKRKGTKFGRPTALDPSQRRRIAERYTAGETMAELAREYESAKRRFGGRCNKRAYFAANRFTVNWSGPTHPRRTIRREAR